MGSNDQRSTIRKVAVSSFLGNFIEWFDYATYSYFAVVIANVFFPGDDPALALMQTFAVFALSFLLRPIGAIFWGSMGDKKGRKWALSTSIFLMTGATFCIGLLPGYLAIGLAAPILLLLLRMIQGFSASGEYAGAATFLAEYAPSDKRGVYCSLVPASTAVGLLVGSTFATVMYTILPDAAVNEWGWRIPFLLAGPLGLVAHYIRTKLEDSPTYQEMQAAISKTDDSNHPIRDLFRHHTKELIISFGAAMLNAVGFYVVLTLMLLNTAQFFTVLAVELVLCLALTINDGTLSSYLTETFPTAVRYTGFALPFNLANALFGGSASFISTALIAATGSGLAPAWYMVGVSCVALVAMILSHEHTGKDLSEV